MDQIIEFTTNHTIIVASFFALLSYILFIEYRTFTQKFEVVTPAGAIQIINQDDTVIVDVRESSELKDGAIADNRHIPLGQVRGKLKELEKHKEKNILVYCRTGQRSASACRTLTSSGFEKVYNLKGGILAWEAEHLPMAKG